jgi:hypothetical protein
MAIPMVLIEHRVRQAIAETKNTGSEVRFCDFLQRHHGLNPDDLKNIAALTGQKIGVPVSLSSFVITESATVRDLINAVAAVVPEIEIPGI